MSDRSAYAHLRVPAVLHRFGWTSVVEVPFYQQKGASNDHYNFPYLEIAFFMALFFFVFEKYLDLRQLRCYRKVKKDDPVPLDIQAIDANKVVTKEKFHSSVSYGIDKMNFGMFCDIFDFSQNWIYFVLGFYPYFWDLSSGVVTSHVPARYIYNELWQEMYTSYVFIVLTSLISTVCSLPFSMYSTFVIEEKHGFNKTTLYIYFTDLIKSNLVSIIFSSLVMGFVWVVRSAGENFYFYLWLFTLCITIIMMTIVPIFIMPLFNKFTPFEEYGKEKGLQWTSLKADIDAMALKLKFPLTKMFVVDGSRHSAHSNAYLYGFLNNKRIVIYDTLLENDSVTNTRKVSDEEILAILGHEMGHWKLSHTVESFLTTQIYLFLTFYLFSKLSMAKGLYEAFGFKDQNCPVLVALMLFGMTFGKLLNEFMNRYQIYRTRCNEFAADNFAVKQPIGRGEGLKSGLCKLHMQNLGNMVPDKYYSMYHYTHPTLVERIRAINAALSKQQRTKSD